MRTPEAIRMWLVDYLAQLVEIEPSEVDPRAPFGEYGVDSAGAAGLSADLSEWLGVQLKESIAFDYPSIEELSAHISSTLREG